MKKTTLEVRQNELETQLAAAQTSLKDARASLVEGTGGAGGVASAESAVRALKDARATVESDIAAQQAAAAEIAQAETRRQKLAACEVAAQSFIQTQALFYKRLDDGETQILQILHDLASARKKSLSRRLSL